MLRRNDTERRARETFHRQDLIFKLSMSLALFAGFVSIVASILLKPTSDSVVFVDIVRDVGLDILRDVGIALLIAVVATVSIEMYASSRLREHIAFDVLSAAYSKVVPEEIYTQVTDHVFRSNVFRRNWNVIIKALPRDRRSGTVVITAEYSYDVENLNEHAMLFPIIASIDLDDPPPDTNIPRFLTFTVFDEQKGFLVTEEDTRKLLAKTAEAVDVMRSTNKDSIEPQREKNLTARRDPRELSLTAEVNIPGRRRVGVSFQVQRAIRVPGYYVLTSATPADGIRITINVDGFRMAVVPLHPDGEKLRNPQRDTWVFDAGILPWQGFRFTSEISTDVRSAQAALEQAQIEQEGLRQIIRGLEEEVSRLKAMESQETRTT
jgi:hypothetical protein